MQVETQATFWINILEREGWLLVNVDGRKLGVLISSTENGMQYLKIAGYHAGEVRFVGERQNVLSVKVEQIPKSRHNIMLPKIVGALPIELRVSPIMFL